MRLSWDDIGKRYMEYGVDHVALYVAKGTAYGTGVVWNGVTGITESPGGAEATDLYADNIKYATLRSAESLGFTIEAYQSPIEFDLCDGTAEISKGVYIGQQSRTSFALSYRTLIANDTQAEDDDGYKLHLIYGASASPSERAYATTNESPEAMTLSWECTTIPISIAGYKPTSRIIIDSRYADPVKLKALEDILIGTEDEEPRMPLPDEVMTMFASESNG